MSINQTNTNSCQLNLSNVPLINLSCLRRSNSWSFIKNSKSSNYFTSNLYLIDAINISSRIPIIYKPRISCSNKDQYKNNDKRMKQIIKNNQITLNKKSHCKSLHTPLNNKSIEKTLILQKKSQILILPKEYQHNSFISYQKLKSELIKNTNPPIYITSHTRFGQSMLALYFQKNRFISPMNNKKKKEE